MAATMACVTEVYVFRLDLRMLVVVVLVLVLVFVVLFGFFFGQMQMLSSRLSVSTCAACGILAYVPS